MFMKYGNSKEKNNSNTNRDISIYTQGTKLSFGYKYNVNHPLINELYKRYKEQNGLAQNFPLSNAQRKEFENYLDIYFAEQEIQNK